MLVRFREAALCAGLLLGTHALFSASESAAQEKTERKLVKRVDPAYPPIAGQLHLSGSVKMALQVNAEGKVESVRITGGSPILAAAAESAAKQWKYEAASKESTENVTIMFESPK